MHGVPDTASVGRVALRVTDLDSVEGFYREVVGLDRFVCDDAGGADDAGDTHATLGVDGTPLLELAADPDAPDRGRDEAGLFHVAFRFPDQGALGDALSRVESSWSPGLTGASDHHVSEALYLSDPVGNGVELYCDRPREAWPVDERGNVEMNTLRLDLDALREDAAGGDRAPSETTVGHVHLEVSSLADAEAFYADALGLNVRQRMGESALFLAAGDYHHHLGTNVWNGRSVPRSPRSRGLDWWELRVPGGVGTVRERLADAGNEPTPVDGGFEVGDGDGIRLRVVAD
jgi:catechol 2,3-dioxygenase